MSDLLDHWNAWNDTKQLRNNLSYLSSGTANRENLCKFSELRAWSVPSILVTRRLDSVTVSEDSEYLTVVEEAGAIDIYFKQDTPASRYYRFTSELSKHFSEQLEVAAKDYPLVVELLCAPVEDLADIWAKSNRLLEDDDCTRSDVQSGDEDERLRGYRQQYSCGLLSCWCIGAAA